MAIIVTVERVKLTDNFVRYAGKDKATGGNGTFYLPREEGKVLADYPKSLTMTMATLPEKEKK